jgi:hypothetical protein
LETHPSPRHISLRKDILDYLLLGVFCAGKHAIVAISGKGIAGELPNKSRLHIDHQEESKQGYSTLNIM